MYLCCSVVACRPTETGKTLHPLELSTTDAKLLKDIFEANVTWVAYWYSVGRREKKYRRIDIFQHRLEVELKKLGEGPWSNRSSLFLWILGPWRGPLDVLVQKKSRTTTVVCLPLGWSPSCPMVWILALSDIFRAPKSHCFSMGWNTTFLSIKSSFFWGNSVNFQAPRPILWATTAHLGAPPIEGFLGRGPCNRLRFRQMTSRNLQVPWKSPDLYGAFLQ